MSVAQLARRLGATATLSMERGYLLVRVRILDAKTAYGQERYLVAPLAGEGSIWVDAARVKFDA